MASVCAALARVALRKLDARNRERNAGVDYLFDRLETLELPGLVPLRPPPHVERQYNFVGPRVRYDAAAFDGLPVERFVAALRAEGARVRATRDLRDWHAQHLQPVIAEQLHPAFHHPANATLLAHVRYGPGTLPVTENPPADRIALPILHRPSRELLDHYVMAFRKVAQHASRLLTYFESDGGRRPE
jgi:dTDP-4-amino-4,6-dideoxygalactose transaminase